MATPIINMFQQFSLSDTELSAGQTLTNNQLMTLQNLRAEYAIKKLNLTFNPNNPQDFVQQEAYMSGWIEAVTYILDCHESIASASQAVNTDDPESGGDASTIFQG